MSPLARFGLVGLLVSINGCNEPDSVRRRAAGEVEPMVVRWMECNDCRGGELDSVVALGEDAVPLLTQFLREGPQPERLDAFEAHVDSTYHRLGARNTRSPDEFKATYSRGFRIGYQERAARALGRIGGGAAADSLRAVPDDSVPPPVRDAIRCALDEQCRR